MSVYRNLGAGWWWTFAHEDLACARRAFEAAADVERVGGEGWRVRQARWWASAAAWLVLAEQARKQARRVTQAHVLAAAIDAGSS